MLKSMFREKPLFSPPQLLILLTLVTMLFFMIDINRRARSGESVGEGEEVLEQEVAVQSTRQVELRATLAYVESEDYVVDYARNEAKQKQPGERIVVPMVSEEEALAAPQRVEATPDPAVGAQPWQAWWQLFTDAPQPVP